MKSRGFHDKILQAHAGDSPDESVYVYWNANMLKSVDESISGGLFSTDYYDATTQLRCKAAGDTEFGSCAAGILRMGNGEVWKVPLAAIEGA